jgi:hypothetical protein
VKYRASKLSASFNQFIASETEARGSTHAASGTLSATVENLGYQLDKCPVCSEPRYEPAAAERAVRVPRQRFSTIPIGPQLQALWSQDKIADAMRYRETHTASILNKLRDFTCGSEYLKAVSDNQIESGDTVLLF